VTLLNHGQDERRGCRYGEPVADFFLLLQQAQLVEIHPGLGKLDLLLFEGLALSVLLSARLIQLQLELLNPLQLNVLLLFLILQYLLVLLDALSFHLLLLLHLLQLLTIEKQGMFFLFILPALLKQVELKDLKLYLMGKGGKLGGRCFECLMTGGLWGGGHGNGGEIFKLRGGERSKTRELRFYVWGGWRGRGGG